MDEPTTSVTPVLELDEVFAALGHPRRRYLVYTLANGESEVALPELAAKIAAWERDIPTDAVSEEARRRVHTSLYHSHVPKLADLGVIEHVEAEGILVRAHNTTQVETVLGGAGAEFDSRQEDHAKDTDA